MSTMAEDGLNPLVLQDVSNWVQSVVEYVKGTRTKCLDLQTVHSDALSIEQTDIRPIFSALVSSEVIELDLGTNYCLPINVKNQVQDLFGILNTTKIEKLSLGGWLTSGDDVLSLLSVLKDTPITHLNISSNGLKFELNQMDEFVSYLGNSLLTSLNLYDNIGMLSFEAASIFSQGLCNTQITCLNLGHALQYDHDGNSPGEEHTEPWYPLVMNLPNTALIDLNLSENALGDSFMKVLGVVLQHSKLEKLNLFDNHITDSGVDFFIPGLTSSRITHLNLSWNRINGDNRLGQSLKNTKIHELNLSSNPISHKRIFSGHNFLKDTVVHTLLLRNDRPEHPMLLFPMKEIAVSKLTSLNVCPNVSALDQVSTLASILRRSELTHVYLIDNCLSAECVSVLGDCLRSSKLKYIDLTHTLDEMDGLDCIASFLDKTKGSAVGALSLGSNDFDFRFESVAPALAGTTFIWLDLSWNCIGESIVSLSAQLKFTAIAELNLICNDIKDHGAAVLAGCLEGTQIIALSLRANSITSVGATALASVLKKTKLRYLDLGENEIQDNGLVFLAEHASSTCITFLDVEPNSPKDSKPRIRRSLIDRVVWENRKQMQRFADILNRTAVFTGDSNIFDFNDVDMEFMDDCLQLYKIVSENSIVAVTIEQDKCISDLEALKLDDDCEYTVKSYGDFTVFVKDCRLIYKKVMEEPCSVRNTSEQPVGVSPFHKKILSLLLDIFPETFISFCRSIEADVPQRVSILRMVEELQLKTLVEQLLLDRPLYTVDENQEILHPYVYHLLYKHKQPVCNLKIEPNGLEKIMEYYSKHSDVNGASELLNLLSNIRLV